MRAKTIGAEGGEQQATSGRTGGRPSERVAGSNSIGANFQLPLPLARRPIGFLNKERGRSDWPRRLTSGRLSYARLGPLALNCEFTFNFPLPTKSSRFTSQPASQVAWPASGNESQARAHTHTAVGAQAGGLALPGWQAAPHAASKLDANIPLESREGGRRCSCCARPSQASAA